MKKMNHPLRTRVTALLLALVCVLGLLPATAFAASDTIKLERFGMSGVSYESAALGSCSLHEMYFSGGNKTSVGFCGTKGAGMGSSLIGQTWGNKTPVSDPTVLTMMAYYYAHSTGVFTDEAKALGVDTIWGGGYTWYMNAWVQAVIWRYQQGSMGDPVTACAEELMAVYNSLEGTHFTSIDQEKDGSSFRSRAQYILDLGQRGVWGECTAYEYGFTGAGSSAHPASGVQKIILGELKVKTEDTYTLIVKKVDSKNPTKGLPGAKFHIESESGSFSKDVTTGKDGTATLENLTPGTYAVTETDPPADYEIDNAGPEYVVLPGNGNNTVTVTFRDTPTITSEGSIRKVDADDPTKGLAGAIIKITGVDNNFSGTFMTREGGYITDVPWDTMPVGSYVAEEMTPPEGYTMSPDQHKIKQTFVWDGKSDVALVFENDAKVKVRLVKLDDSNNPLPGAVFNIVKDGQIVGTEATKADGSITVTDVTEGMYAFVEVSVPKPYAKLTEPVIAYVDQAAVNGGGTVTVTASDKKLPNLTILKRDKQTKEVIPGTVFEIKGIHYHYHNDVTTGADGKAVLSNIPVDSYEITEKSVPDPYVVGDEPMQTIYLGPGEDRELIFDNLKQPLLTIAKIDADTQEKIPGTVFTIQGISSDYKHDVTTGADGTVSLRVAPGSYKITEKSAPAPYYLPSRNADREQTISLNPGDEKTVTFKDHKVPELTIFKEDSVAGAPIEGAKFHVTFTSNGEAADAPGSIDYGYLFTDTRGEIKVHEQGKKLYPGEYTVTEVAPAPGFQMKEPITQKVIIHGGESKTLTFQNEPLNGIVVQKYDSVTGEALPGCTFQLRFLGGTSGTGGTVIGQKVTGKNGTCIWTGLTAGTYIVEEVDPADGYSIIKSSETVYISDDGVQNVVTVSFDNAPDGLLLIRKVCSVNPSITLQDAEFKITYADGSVIGDSNGIYRTDENGEIRISGLKPGKSVIVTETKAPAGFLIDTQSQTVQIKEGRTVSLTFKNQPKGQLIVQKRDNITGQPLPGAEFRVTTAAGCEVGLDGVIGTSTLTQGGIFKTDSNGEIRVSNLAPGAYVLTEIKAPAGYVMDEPSKNVVIGTNGDTQTVVVTNTPKGGLLIRKTDSVTGKALSGVKFKITAANGELIPDNEGLTSSNGLYTTDENGQIYLRKLNPNTYVVTEVETIDGYLLNAAPQTVVVSEADTQVLSFTNMPLGGLLVKKMDSATKEPLADVIFKITRTDGTVVGNSNGEYRTDERGFISLPDLEPGGYIVREVQAKPGYLLDDTPHAVEIKDHQTYTLEVFNQPLGNLIINKLSSADNSPLEGVKFQIKYANGQVVDNKNGQVSSNGIYYTDRNGQIILSGVTGTVVVTELETIPGYRIDPNTRTQTVVINPNDTQTINFYNTPTTTLIIRKFVEGTENEPLSGVAFRVVDGAGAAVGPDDGLYYTDKSGEIVLHGIEPGTVVIAREVKTAEGFVLDGTPQDIKIEAGHVQQLTFWNKRAGTLVIQKKDKVSGAFIAGAEFQLTYANGGYVDNDNGHLSSKGLYTTNDKGEIRVSGVVGTIVAKETKAAPGYVIDQTTQTQTVTVNPMDTQTLVFLNDPLCSLTLTKLDSVTGKAVPGTEFAVKDGDGNVLARCTTGKDGTATVTGLVPGSTVIVVETRVPSGYVLDTTPKSIVVKNGSGNSFISGGNTSGGSNSGGNSSGSNSSGNDLTFENDPKMSLTIHKYVEGTANEPLAGVAFKVVDGSGKPLNPDGGIYYTNDAGEIVLEGLEPGTTITAQEVKTVDGYVLDGRPQSIKIEAGKAQNLTFWNKPAGSLVIRKLDKQTGKPLAGVEFEAIYAEGGYVDTDNGHLSSKGLYTTDDHGEIHISGIVGTVVVKETRPLPGYTIEPGRESQTVTVNPQETQTLTFYNIPANTLTIQKYVDGSDNEPLAGVEFLVTDSSGAVVGPNNGYYTTDKDGRISIPGLTPGTTITVKETKTLDGFILDGQPQSITIKEGEAQSLTFRNKRAGGLIINKIDAVSKEPLAGVKFRITYADGSNVDLDGGKISSNGLYTTNTEGQIVISGITGTVIVTELEALPGYVLDPNAKSQTVQVHPNDTQTITFQNTPIGGLTIIKKDEESGERISGVQFEIRKLNGEVIGTYTTDRTGVITLPQAEKGWYQVTELQAAKGYRLDSQPYQIEVKDGGTATLEITNRQSGSAIIRKVDSLTGEGIYGVKFLISDASGHPVGTYESDNEGYVYIERELPDGKYTARELECADGYILDTVPKTFYVEYGGCTTITWPNTAVRGQIQIVKKSADYNSTNGLPAGTLLEGATFEICNERTGNKVDTIVTGANGLASSKQLPLGRYTIREVKAPANYGVSTETYTAVLEYSGQIVKLEVSNKSMSTGVSITKTGPKEAMSGQPVRYVFSKIGNSSNVMLQSFYWRDTLPAAVRLTSVVTGTYNFPGTYKIVYKVNNSGDYRTLADSLSTSQNYTLAASPVALGLASNERVTEIMFVFGQVPGGFSQVEAPMIYCKTISGLAAGSSFANVADVGGTYNGVWVQAVSRWVTTVYGKKAPTPKLPRTGY
nr:SpaA isopeptide-forming pilin-related protein [uncultured Oscillibacter sp.]